MSSYKSKPATLEEINKWSQDKLINPRTKRKIKKSSPIYKYLNNQFNSLKSLEEGNDKEEATNAILSRKLSKKKKKNSNKVIFEEKKEEEHNIDQTTLLESISEYLGPAKGNHLLSVDNKDPITQEDIWIRTDGKKEEAIDIPSYKLFSYTDTEDKIRCFNIETIISMINNNCLVHPITGLTINDDTIERAKKMHQTLKEKNVIQEKKDERTDEEKINNYAFDVFQKFSIISIFVDHQWFLKLKSDKLDKLNYELGDFYDKNVDDENKILMVPPDGKAFDKSKSNFSDLDLLEKRQYLLENIDKVISSSEDSSMKTLGSYLMLGGLGVVCKEIRDNYPDFVYGFSLD